MRELVGWLCLLAACGDDGGPKLDPGPPRTVITEPGTGPESTGPLWPLRPGLSGDDLVVGEPVAMGDYQAYPVMRPGTPHSYDGPRNWYFLAATPDGVVLLGNPRDGLYPRPLLIVPAHVRDGMKWTVDPGDGGVVVTCGASSPFGTDADPTHWDAPSGLAARPWTIDCGRDWAFGEPGRNIKLDAKLVEGWGPGALTATVRPMNDNAVESEPPPPAITLEPLNGGMPLGTDFRADRLGAFINPARDGAAARIIVEGQGYDASADQNGNFNTYVPVPATLCLLFDGTSISAPPDTVGLDYEGVQRVCPDPVASVIGPTGTLDSDIGYCVPNTQNCSAFTPLIGIYSDATHTRGIGTDALTGKMWAGDLHLPADPTMPMLDNIEAFSPTTILGLFQVIPDGAVMRLGITNDPSRRSSSGNVLSSATVGPGAVRDIRPETYVTTWSITRTATGRTDLHTTPDGRIERFHFGETGLRVEVIGQVALRAEEWLAGAVEIDGALVIVTQDHFIGWDTQLFRHQDSVDHTSIQVDPGVKPDLGSAYLWRADLPPSSAPAVLPPARRAVTAVSDTDVISCWANTGAAPSCHVRVCWPNDAAPELTGWQFASVITNISPAIDVTYDATAVADGSSCIVVTAPAGTQHGGPYDENPRYLVGTLPHLGRVAINLRTQ